MCAEGSSAALIPGPLCRRGRHAPVHVPRSRPSSGRSRSPPPRAAGRGGGDLLRTEEGRLRGTCTGAWRPLRQSGPGMSAAELPSAHIRLRLGQEDAHYGGNLVAGATQLRIVGDLITELAMRYDGDEGLFRSYESVEFLAPLYAC